MIELDWCSAQDVGFLVSFAKFIAQILSIFSDKADLTISPLPVRSLMARVITHHWSFVFCIIHLPELRRRNFWPSAIHSHLRPIRPLRNRTFLHPLPVGVPLQDERRLRALSMLYAQRRTLSPHPLLSPTARSVLGSFLFSVLVVFVGVDTLMGVHFALGTSSSSSHGGGGFMLWRQLAAQSACPGPPGSP